MSGWKILWRGTVEMSSFTQIKLPDGSLLVFTKEEVERARKRGNSIIHNRKLKGRDLGPEVIGGERVEDA